MNRKNIINFCRKLIPGLTVNIASDTELIAIISVAVAEISQRSEFFSESVYFDAIEGQNEYFINEIMPLLVKRHESGIKFYDGSQYKILHPKTRKYWDSENPYWEDAANATPREYIIEGNKITIYPTPNEDVSSGFKLYGYTRPEDMSDDNHYPFGVTTKLSRMDDLFDFAIINFVKWKLAPMLGEEVQSEKAFQEYEFEYQKAFYEYNSAKDIIMSEENVFKGPHYDV